MDTFEKNLTNANKKGLHVRAATLLAQTANRFRSSVTIERDGERADAKSVMNLLLLTATIGTKVRVIVTGQDAREAMKAITKIIEERFGE